LSARRDTRPAIAYIRQVGNDLAELPECRRPGEAARAERAYLCHVRARGELVEKHASRCVDVVAKGISDESREILVAPYSGDLMVWADAAHFVVGRRDVNSIRQHVLVHIAIDGEEVAPYSSYPSTSHSRYGFRRSCHGGEGTPYWLAVAHFWSSARHARVAAQAVHREITFVAGHHRRSAGDGRGGTWSDLSGARPA
jgi:hypothetical protein